MGSRLDEAGTKAAMRTWHQVATGTAIFTSMVKRIPVLVKRVQLPILATLTNIDSCKTAPPAIQFTQHQGPKPQFQTDLSGWHLPFTLSVKMIRCSDPTPTANRVISENVTTGKLATSGHVRARREFANRLARCLQLVGSQSTGRFTQSQ